MPSGGFADSTPGFGVVDASVGSQGDAYDNGAMVFVNNQIFAASAGFPVVNGQFVDAGTQVLSGLSTRLQYYVSPTSATLRVFTALTNTTGSTIFVPVAYVNNSGSDGGTIIKATGSGDLVFGTDDTYLISDDGDPTGSDPANTYVFYGAGAGLTPSSVSTTVFNAASTEGTLGTFSLAIAPGETQSLLFFNQLNPTTANAIANVGVFANLNSLNAAGLLDGLSSAELGSVRNFNVAPVPEPGSIALFVGMTMTSAGFFARRKRARKTA